MIAGGPTVSNAHGGPGPWGPTACRTTDFEVAGSGTPPALAWSRTGPAPDQPLHSHLHPCEGPLTMTSDALRSLIRCLLLGIGVLLGSAGTLAAQGIVSGRVTDYSSGSPLVGA